jgi:hypothetical protein
LLQNGHCGDQPLPHSGHSFRINFRRGQNMTVFTKVKNHVT